MRSFIRDVRAALYLFVLSIPFEMPNRTIPIEIPTLFGSLFLLATFVSRHNRTPWNVSGI